MVTHLVGVVSFTACALLAAVPAALNPCCIAMRLLAMLACCPWQCSHEFIVLSSELRGLRSTRGQPRGLLSFVTDHTFATSR